MNETSETRPGATVRNIPLPAPAEIGINDADGNVLCMGDVVKVDGNTTLYGTVHEHEGEVYAIALGTERAVKIPRDKMRLMRYERGTGYVFAGPPAPAVAEVESTPVAPETTAPATPELDKQRAAIEDGAHRIGEFLDWLMERGYHIGRYNENGRAYDAGPQFAELIAAFYDIDLNKIEEERRAILEYLRSR